MSPTTLAYIGTDLAALALLVGALYLPRHGRRDLIPQELLAEIREFGGDMKETYGVPVEAIEILENE